MTLLLSDIDIQTVSAQDLGQIIRLDERVTNNTKQEYWQDIFERYGEKLSKGRFFLVAKVHQGKAEGQILGFIVGEIRVWEFGSEPCGWVFAFSVEPDTRLQGIGERLFEAMSAKFRQAGMKTMRTMVARHNQLHMAFFRSEGMVAGPYIQLEKPLGKLP